MVWGKVVMKVSKDDFLPTTVEYFDEDGLLVRVLQYKEVRSFQDRKYPTIWVMTPKTADKIGHQTVFRVESAVFDLDISKEYFTKRALKRFSR